MVTKFVTVDDSDYKLAAPVLDALKAEIGTGGGGGGPWQPPIYATQAAAAAAYLAGDIADGDLVGVEQP